MGNRQHIHLASPHMSSQGYEQFYVKEAFETNWVAPMGKNIDEFEREIAKKLGAREAVALNSGTAALHLALKSAGVGEGDVVFCQSLTFSASANPIAYLKATPVFIDSDLKTWNLSPDALERAFEKYPRVKAVIAVHLYGMAAEMDEICALCKKNGSALVEDAAESLGTTYKGQYTGSFGDYGILSFNGNKIITSSGGGMLLFRGEEAKARAEKARFWATQARDPAPHYQHSEIGYNYRMSNISAGIGRGQLRVLDERVAKKQYIYHRYRNAFAKLEGIGMMPLHDWENCNCWLSAVQLRGKITPQALREALAAAEIESRPIWKPMHRQPVFAGCDYLDNGGIAEGIFKNGLCLPSDTKMPDEELERVIRVIKELW